MTSLRQMHRCFMERSSFLPGDVRHGAQGIKALGDGDSGHLVHRQDSGFLLGQQVHQLGILSRVDEAEQRGRFFHQFHFMDPQSRVENRCTDLEADAVVGRYIQ